MKVINLIVKNFKRIEGETSIAPGSVKLVKITGANMSGKSSMIEALKSLLAGGKARLAHPVHDGAEEAVVIGEFGNDKVEMTATLTQRPGKPDTLTIVPMRPGFTPQALMDYLTGGKAFDPLEFSTMQPKQQFETLRRLVPLTDSKKKPLDPVQLDFLNKEDFKARALLNAQVKRLDAQHSAIEVPKGTPEKEVDVSALATKLSSASTHNAGIELAKSRRADSIGKAERNLGIAQRKQEELKAALAQAEADEKRFAVEIKGLKTEKDGAPIDISAMQKEIESAGEINRAVAAKARKAELTEESKRLDKEADTLTVAMEARTEEKTKAMERSKFPVKGLAFGDDEVLFRGLPFDQASQAEQLMVSVRIGMSLNHEMKIMYSKFGALLDEKRWKELENIINESDWDGQLFIEDPDTSGKVGIVMVDGQVASDNL